MKQRSLWAGLLGILTLLFPPSVHAGGPPQPGVATGSATWKSIITLGNAGGLAIDRRGDPNRMKWGYAPNPYNRTLVKFGTGGSRLGSWRYAPPANRVSPVGVAVGGAGSVFIADGGTNRVVKFDPSGRQLAAFGGFGTPVGVALDRKGNIYVAEQNTFRVTKLSPTGQVLARWHVPWVTGMGTGVPLSIAVDSQGSVYLGVGCYQNECPPPHGIQSGVVKLSSSGALLWSLLGNNPYTQIGSNEQPFVTVSSVAIDSGNRLYVGSSSIRTPTGTFYSGVLVYAGNGMRQASYSLPGNNSPNGIAFDGRNALYVAYGKQILKRLQ